MHIPTRKPLSIILLSMVLPGRDKKYKGKKKKKDQLLAAPGRYIRTLIMTSVTTSTLILPRFNTCQNDCDGKGYGVYAYDHFYLIKSTPIL